MIDDKDLIYFSQWKSPGQFKSGTVSLPVGGDVGASSTRAWYIDIPVEGYNTYVGHLYFQSPAWNNDWVKAPDVTNMGPPTYFGPIHIRGKVVGSTYRIEAAYANTAGEAVNIPSHTYTLRYFLYV